MPDHLHLRHFFGPLVNQQHQEKGVGIVGGDPVDDRLEKHRLPCACRSDDQGTLSLTERSDEVDDSIRVVARTASGGIGAFENELFVRMGRGQRAEIWPLRGSFRVSAANGVDLKQGRALSSSGRRAGLAVDDVAGLKAKAADDILRDENVFG